MPPAAITGPVATKIVLVVLALRDFAINSSYESCAKAEEVKNKRVKIDSKVFIFLIFGLENKDIGKPDSLIR